MSIFSHFCRALTRLSTLLMSDDKRQGFDFRFLATDVRNQIVHSRELLNRARELREIKSKIEDEEAKQQLDKTINGILDLVESMNDNTAVTATSSISTLTQFNIFSHS
jgi:hypothetical protein